MKKYILPGFAFILSSAAVIGYVYDVDFILTLNTTMEPIKPITAICLILISLMQIFIISNIEKERQYKEIVLTVCSYWVWLLELIAMGNLIIQGDSITRATTDSYMPSLMAVVLLYLNSAAGIVYIFNSKRVCKRLYRIAVITIVMGMLCITGYAARVPILFFELKGVSNAMNILTGFLFLMLGVNLILIQRKITEGKSKRTL